MVTMGDQTDNPPSEGENTARDVPVIWLLGKTGAGKSSLIRALTGLDAVELGNGFRSCTRTAKSFDFPDEEPLLRFLDTRGLGEVSYDPEEDLDACEGHSHALLVVARLDDQVQGEVSRVLRDVLSRRKKMPVLIVHTGADLVEDDDARERARATTQAAYEKAARREIDSIAVALPPGGTPDPEALEELKDALDDIIPAAGLLLRRERGSDPETEAFNVIRRRVLYHSGIAGASDAIPAVGLFASTGVQVNMLRELGAHYGYPMTQSALRGFLAALGLGIGARFALGVGARQLGKLIPVYGQTAGAALASTLTFAATYAIGRAAAYYLFWMAQGETPTSRNVRAVFSNAFKRATPKDADV